MPLQTFDPPGHVDDLSPDGRRAWHDFISGLIDDATIGDTSVSNNSPRPQFINPSRTEISADAGIDDVKWTAFPRIVSVSSGSDRQRWQKADAARAVQDEYCEWSVARNDEGKIVRIDFTCEGPEYWRFLAAVDPGKTLDLYRKHVSPDVKKTDLFTPAGRYVSDNIWNNSTSHGAMHLIQRNNTLGAEIEIAAAATIVRSKPDGTAMTDQRELILCGAYGAPERNSDPFIGARANFWARQGALVSIGNPVGIYFAGLNTQDWEMPDGSDPAALWAYTRGSPDRPVRAVLSVPTGKSFTLGDVTIRDVPIAFGAQVADDIQMTIRAVADKPNSVVPHPTKGCARRQSLTDSVALGGVSVSDVLSEPHGRGRI